MSVYKIPITTAFIFFPLMAFIFTLPFLIYQYRKYGSIPFLRSAIFYSFILYLLCMYFLVILPLPSIEEVKKLTTPTTQLIPFDFMRDILNIPFNWKNLSSYLDLIKSPAFYIAAFNILLTVPFGIYLRYYFECKWYKALTFGFLLSIFFELTQLSGLYGIYPRAYRLFDVDDLILNTAGTMLGFLITPLIAMILPTRKELDEKSFKKGKRVTFFRRALSYIIDFLFLTISFVIIRILLNNTVLSEYTSIITIIFYYLIIPLVTNGKTFGKMILKLQVAAKQPKFAILKVMSRYLLSYILFYYQFIIINLLNKIVIHNNIVETIISCIIILLKVYFWINIVSIILNMAKKEKMFLYEKITNTENCSTIEYEEEKDESKSDKIKKDEKEEEENVRIKKHKEKL